MNILKYFLKTNRLLIISFLITFILAIILTVITNLYLLHNYYVSIFPMWLTYTKELSYFFNIVSIAILLVLTFKVLFGKNRNLIIKFYGKSKYLIFLAIFNLIIFILVFTCVSLIIYTINMRSFIFDTYEGTMIEPSLYLQLLSCLRSFMYAFIYITFINILFYIILICKEFYKNSKYKYFSVKKRVLHLIRLIITHIFKLFLLTFLFSVISLNTHMQFTYDSIFQLYIPISSLVIMLSSICILFIIFLDYVRYFLDEIYV